VSPGRTRASVLASALLMTRITGPEARGAPLGASLTGLPFCESREVPQAYPPICPQKCRTGDRFCWNNREQSVLFISCFGSRKTNEAWNPGNFGCRGLLVYGLAVSVVLNSFQHDVQRSSGPAPSSFSRFERSGSGYLFPLAQLNRTTRSSF